MLAVFDSCEHVVESVAALAVDLLKSAPGLNILATCREPLRAEGECVRRLTPLKVPPTSHKLTATEALAFPAVQLFLSSAPQSAQRCLRGARTGEAPERPVSVADARPQNGSATPSDVERRTRLGAMRCSQSASA